jgi:hypothetical protein
MGKALLLVQDCIHCFKTSRDQNTRTVLYHSPSGKIRQRLFLCITTDTFVITQQYIISRLQRFIRLFSNRSASVSVELQCFIVTIFYHICLGGIMNFIEIRRNSFRFLAFPHTRFYRLIIILVYTRTIG